MHATKLVTPSGEELVILPADEYQRLLDIAEDAIDSAWAIEMQRRLKSGEEELIPAEYVERMIAGESPVRVWREFRGITRKVLAESSGVNATYLAEIETNKKPGSVKALQAIAEALRVSIDDLL